MNEASTKEFERIYETSEWGSRSRSGPGSLPELNASYLKVLRSIIAEFKIESVVDVGCGDWSLYESFDWHSINVKYTGVDVVPQLIDRLNQLHRRGNVEFRCVDVLGGGDLPRGDLYILKDVMQHWSNERVFAFLPGLRGCRLALLTNDVEKYSRRRRLLQKLVHGRPIPNGDTEVGGYRPLRLREPPFNLQAQLRHNYSVDWEGTLFLKETLLYTTTES